MSETYSGYGLGNAHLEPGMPVWPHGDYEYPGPAAAQQPFSSLGSLEASWDPAEELAFLLRGQSEAEEGGAYPPDSSADESNEDMPDAERLAGLTQVTEELPRVRPAPGHRRLPPRRPSLSPLQRLSYLIVAIAAVIVSMVSVLGGVITYDPLRRLPGLHASYGVGCLWPVLVYGPWLVASLSVLRAALHRRRAMHSWAVVLFFSTVAMLLCIAQSPKTLTGVATGALPALAALACFQQLVRQITLTRPPRRTVSRRSASTPPPAAYRSPKPKSGA